MTRSLLCNHVWSLQTWFCQNRMALNPDKSGAILIGTAQRAHSYSDLTSVNVAGTTVPLASNISILGAESDSNLTLDNHTMSLSQSCFYRIHALRQIREAPANRTAPMVASALVSAHLDYVNVNYDDIGHKPYRPRLYRPQTKSATDHISHSVYHIGHKQSPYRPQTTLGRPT